MNALLIRDREAAGCILVREAAARYPVDQKFHAVSLSYSNATGFLALSCAARYFPTVDFPLHSTFHQSKFSPAPHITGGTDVEIRDFPPLQAAGVGRRGEGLFQGRRSGLRVSRQLGPRRRGEKACHAEQDRRLPEHRGGTRLRR